MKEETSITYENVIIIGSNCENAYRYIQAKFKNNSNVLILGNGAHSLQDLHRNDVLSILEKRINEQTKITIIAHGIAFENMHFIDKIKSEDFLSNLVDSIRMPDLPLNIILFSCFGGAASLPENATKGTILAAYSSSNAPISVYESIATLNILSDNTPLLESLINRLPLHTTQTLSIQIKEGSEEIFKQTIRPPASIIFSAQEIIRYFDYQRKELINNYRLEKNITLYENIKPFYIAGTEELTNEAMEMALDWRSGFFNYLIFIKSEELVEELKNKIISDDVKLLINNTRNGATPLNLAVSTENRELVDFFINNGANLEVRDNIYGDTVLLNAARKNNTEIVDLLINKGANLKATNNIGENAISIALKNRLNGINSNRVINILKNKLSKEADQNVYIGTLKPSTTPDLKKEQAPDLKK
jgi:predicted Fe-Mo cluster-binding NifX family protein